ncbi:MAG: acetoin utilization protein AcuC [Proteobacteria bacterium]|nr:acetoin utilization protein AcuC [Pseudomonadota bacterium]MCH8106026.1 acetoin utilization protein AcuC [Pseudomonadota bacterium]
MSRNNTCVYLGQQLADYGFKDGHPFGPQRHDVFQAELLKRNLDKSLDILQPVKASRDLIELFHTSDYIEKVQDYSKLGNGYLDDGDTPSFVGMFEAASNVAGSVTDAIDRIMAKQFRRAFSPIAGLHHARRHVAAGFCVFNDCGIAIEYLRAQYGIKRVAYIDIDAHHGDGVFYSFEEDPDLLFADIHQDGLTLYPGTGFAEETGKGAAVGTKLNLPVPPFADDSVFQAVWPKIETYLEENEPEFILLQCGADSIKGDPITNMAFSPASHAYAAKRLCAIADRYCEGKILAMGGGGYNHDNIARAWTAVVDSMINAD